MNTIWDEIDKKMHRDWTSALQRVKEWKAANEKVVFTNGCFDLLHLGHLKYLAEAADLGQRLIIGLNSDSSVRILKGPSRPVKEEYERAMQLVTLSYVDGIVLFNEETPKELITYLMPDILVKGGDYTIDQIVGAQEVLSAGGKVKILSFIEGYSTSDLIQKIKAQ